MESTKKAGYFVKELNSRW